MTPGTPEGARAIPGYPRRDLLCPGVYALTIDARCFLCGEGTVGIWIATVRA